MLLDAIQYTRAIRERTSNSVPLTEMQASLPLQTTAGHREHQMMPQEPINRHLLYDYFHHTPPPTPLSLLAFYMLL